MGFSITGGVRTLILLSVFFFWFSATQSQSVEQKYITLNEAVNLLLSNNPHAKNARLQVEVAHANKASSIEINPTEFTYSYGQLNNAVNDMYFEVNQNFGSPLAHYYKHKMNNEDLNYQKTLCKIAINELTALLKSSWFEWVFAQNKVALVEEELRIFEETLDGFFNDTIAVNSNKPLLMQAQTKYADIQNRNFQASQDYKLASNKMKGLLFTTDEIAPADTTLEMYAISTKTNGPDKFYPATYIQLYNENINLKKWESNYERSKLFPEITAGYFNQQIDLVKGFEGIMVGITVPLWFFPQKAKIKQASLQQNIARNELDYHKFDLELRIENLKIELDKLFVQISFFSENVLKQIENDEQLTITRYKNHEMPLNEMLDTVQAIYSKRLEFLEAVKKYNQVAVELEFLVN